MIQEGNLGLMAAAERYNPERGFRFSTYAVYWVRQRILRSISDSSRIIRLPAHVHTTLQKIRKTKAELKQHLGREPSLTEVGFELNISVEKLILYTESSRNVISLELPLSSSSSKDDTRTIGDMLVSDAPTPEEDAQAEHLQKAVRKVMETSLLPKERQVLTARFGLEDGKQLTLAETAKRLNLSRDRVRLVEARALNKLRSPQRNYRLKEYYGESSHEELPIEKKDRIWFF
jgi:RNA polymerase primary sigma factor